MTQIPPNATPLTPGSDSFPEHRHSLLEIISKEALAPAGSPKVELQMLAMLFAFCMVAPLFVLFGCSVEGWHGWSVVLPLITQLIGASITFYWLFQVTPRSYSILQVSKNMRSSFRKKFSADPRPSDLENAIKILERPARTLGHYTIDFLVSNSPVKWSVLLLVGALGVSVIPLLDTNIKAEEVEDLRLSATVLGLIFGFLEFIRIADKFLDEKRLDAAREWLQQIRDNVFPL